MEMLLAITRVAKAHKLNKDERRCIRQWYLYEALEVCYRTHLAEQWLCEECPRCQWLCNVNRQLPSRWVRKFLKQWYKQ